MDPKRYPADWKQISAAVRARSYGRCECAGECGGHSGACSAIHGQAHPQFGSRVILTAAHLWRGPCAEHHAQHFKCGEMDHLKAMCQPCHLRYDLPNHVALRARNRREKKAAGDLFDGDYGLR